VLVGYKQYKLIGSKDARRIDEGMETSETGKKGAYLFVRKLMKRDSRPYSIDPDSPNH